MKKGIQISWQSRGIFLEISWTSCLEKYGRVPVNRRWWKQRHRHNPWVGNGRRLHGREATPDLFECKNTEYKLKHKVQSEYDALNVKSTT